MHTHDDKYLIENRAIPRSRMLYINRSYTPLTEDVVLVGAEMALATQDSMAAKDANAQGIMRMHWRHEGRRNIPEIASGAIITQVS